MKNNLFKLVSLVLSTALISSCGLITPSNPGSSSNSGQESNSDSGSTSEQTGGVDKLISDYLYDMDLTVPSMNSFNLETEVFYYYAGGLYIVCGYSEAPHETEFLAMMNQATGWVSANDDYWYTVEEYGYMFADDADDPTVELDFYDTDDGGFYFNLYRYDGGHGLVDVSNVDTSWYVDYVNMQYMTVSETVPASELKTALGVNKTLTDLNASQYVYGFIEAYTDEDGYDVPDTFLIVIQNDRSPAISSALSAQGFEMRQASEEVLDLETFDYVTVTYYEGYDTTHELYVTVKLDDYNNTAISFNKFDDVLSDTLTSNTAWTSAEQTTMTTYLNRVMPFFQMGDGYTIGQVADSSYPYVYVADNYYQDRTSQIAQVLLNNGFTPDSTSYDETVYVHDDKTIYVEAWLSYNCGNMVAFYYEPTHYVAATAITLSDEAINIVAGGNYQLSAELTPSSAQSTYEYSCNKPDVATVNEVGMVSVSNTAPVGETFVITVTTSENITDSCTFTIVEDVLTDFTLNSTSLNLAPGQNATLSVASTLPHGMPAPSLTFEMKSGSDEHIHVSDAGVVSIDSDATVGQTGTVVVTAEGTTISKEVPVNVVSAEVTDTLTQTTFGLTNGTSTYAEHAATGESGASYTANCAASHGIQIRSKTSDSGIIGHNELKVCKSITITFDTNTAVPNQDRVLDIYASNTAFTIEDMFAGTMTKVGSITFDSANLTQTYTFTGNYHYIGLRSNSGAIYMTSIDVVWGL